MEPTATPVRSSGIPRPTSRLPVLSKKPSHSSLPRPTAATATKPSAYKPPPTTRSVPGPAQRRASATGTEPPVFKRPVGRPLSRQAKAAIPQSRKTSNAVYERNTEDVLGDLDGFRSASRASSRASSRADFRDNEQEYELEDGADAAKPTSRKSRPSLSERTVETISQLTSSPAGSRRRRSSFFNGDTMGPPARPGSALSNGRRPTTSDGTAPALPSTPQKGLLGPQKGAMTTPGKRSASAATSSVTPSRISSIGRPFSTAKKLPQLQTQNVQSSGMKPPSNSKTMVPRTLKSRHSLMGMYGQATSPQATTPIASPSPVRRESTMIRTPQTVRKTTSSATLRESLVKAKAVKRAEPLTNPQDSAAKPSSSQALREQIAKAKQAARQANAPAPQRTSTPPREAIVPDPAELATFDFGLDDDPFNQRPKGGPSLLRKRIDAARADGRMNIAAMDLNEIPDEVLNMYQYNADDTTAVAWGEVVDLTSLIAADNNIEVIPEAMFPDVDYETAMESEDVVIQFGGVQNIDLHGNVLRELPTGLRRLPQLSKLNLSRNNVSAGALEIIFQIRTLRELKLAENRLEGAFPSSIENLMNLETLELQGNKLTHLPVEIRALTQLRSLNISDNKISGLPDELFTSTSIVELDASKNSFGGCFFRVNLVSQLQTLRLGNNSFTSVCESDEIQLPSLKFLDLSANRLSQMPNVSSWVNLATLLLGNNSLSALPEGFSSLHKLRNADFTANNLTSLDPQIARMESLDNLTLAANPLRERKFLTMGAEEIKRDLMGRLEPADAENPSIEFDGGNGVILGSAVENLGWKLTPSGTLDLSSQKLDEVDEEALASFSQSNEIRQLYLQQNSLTTIPLVTAQLQFLSVLDLSKNDIIEPLTDSLTLPKLRELRLTSNRIRSFDTITSMLSAPSLQQLDVTNNRIRGSLPVLREFYPELTMLMASDNNIDELSAESLEGLKVATLSNNDIPRLEPRIGLLAGTLTSLDVDGNPFRVPNYAILKKGTVALLTWLKDKIPSPPEDFSNPGSPAF